MLWIQICPYLKFQKYTKEYMISAHSEGILYPRVFFCIKVAFYRQQHPYNMSLFYCPVVLFGHGGKGIKI